MVGLDLLAQAQAAGLTVAAAGDRLIIRGPKSAAAVARRLIDAKADVLSALNCRRLAVRSPMPQEIEHRHLSCTSTGWWLHVWNVYYCADCWPCKNAKAIQAHGVLT